jgi:tRNA-(ms[2]io[6]A)-hydroxylase
MALVRPPSQPLHEGPGSWLGDRTVDEMLICALIEARSHDRFVALSGAPIDPDLRGLYEDLAAAEERHGSMYVELATEAGGDAAAGRLAELALEESRIVTRPGMPVRMHSGGEVLSVSGT